MSFTKSKSTLITKTAPDGTVVGTETSTIDVTYQVKAVYINEASAYAELHVSYDGGTTWQLFQGYEVTIEYTSGTNCLDQAEAQILLLDEFKE
ncbi:hypothetical protein KNV77_gp064 [Klebsiella phage vB_KpnP_P184]|uniref:Uncharacterized protein n=1 Tax=Klebsiella phage vB_KpnP_P184 TaxID=2806547 RepID=A0A898K9T5_9CAUD|nr:hypothetical protein KNV77_gp064 [Klebsiella phage vB_KpnP_P184]QSJ03636.1 hypothetical protein [Klebsiella phage vB_KpnP_P184]